MEFRDTPEEAAFRAEVRAFIRARLPVRVRELPEFDGRFRPPMPEQQAVLQEWKQALAERGWIAPHWPTKYGGAGMSTVEYFIFQEECATARAPHVAGHGVTHIGPILIAYGTEEQRREHLPRITSGEIVWSQGYSEPGAGSDLASLQTRAVRDGDEYVINGQKIWSSGAHQADWMFVLVRTDADAHKHRGISMLLVPLTAPGVTVVPLVNMANEHHFNETFFENVRVPARDRVGEENRGWYLGAALLDHERSMIRPVVEMRQTLNTLLALARDGQAAGGPAPSAALKAELAERHIEVTIALMFSKRLVSMQKRGLSPNYEASMSFMHAAETRQRIASTGMKLIGLYGTVAQHPRYAPLEGRIVHAYLKEVSATIAGGSSQIQRNVMATRGLGLPRS